MWNKGHPLVDDPHPNLLTVILDLAVLVTLDNLTCHCLGILHISDMIKIILVWYFKCFRS